MTRFTVALTLVCQTGLAAIAASSGQAATNFNGSTIVAVDEQARTITFRTREGERWTLPVNEASWQQKDRLAPGDQVSIEIDLNDRIVKVLKPSDAPQAARSDSRDDAP